MKPDAAVRRTDGELAIRLRRLVVEFAPTMSDDAKAILLEAADRLQETQDALDESERRSP